LGGVQNLKPSRNKIFKGWTKKKAKSGPGETSLVEARGKPSEENTAAENKKKKKKNNQKKQRYDKKPMPHPQPAREAKTGCRKKRKLVNLKKTKTNTL